MSYRVSFLLFLLISATALDSRTQSKTDTASRTVCVDVIESTDDLRDSLVPKPALAFGPVALPRLTISVDESVAYQQMEGFGASLTDSSAWLLSSKLGDADRKDVLEKLFDPEKGIGLSVLRQPMGASDFARSDYSYDDMPPGHSDPDLKHFSVAKDETYIIPVLKQALAINPQLKIIASPWSPPGWMKTSDSMIQGALLPTAYRPFANYFVKFVAAYKERGIPIYAVTMQNEPMNIPNDYPGMGMTAVEQTAFLRDYLGPSFRDAGLKTRILVFDHNWDLIEYPIKVLNDPKAESFAAGIAIHCYGGNVTAQAELHNRFPDKDIWHTECSGGDWQSGKILQQQARLIIGATRNWAKSVVLWNLALDQDHGPYLGGCRTCRGVVTVNHKTSPSAAVTTVDYAALGHASKFVRPGAYRIESNTFDQGSIEDVAFRNPDGSLVVVVVNSGGSAETFNVQWAHKYFQYTLQAGNVATFKWNPASAAH